MRAKGKHLPLIKTLRALSFFGLSSKLQARRSALVRGISYTSAQRQKAEVGRKTRMIKEGEA